MNPKPKEDLCQTTSQDGDPVAELFLHFASTHFGFRLGL